MISIFRVIRYSSTGIFLAGIFTTIVGCSTEDQLRALILFLLLLLTGGGSGTEMQESGPSFSGPQIVIDSFSTPLSLSVPCVDALTSRSIVNSSSVVYDQREIISNGLAGDSTQLDINISGGTGRFDLAAGAGRTCSGVLMDYPQTGTQGPAIDVSRLARVVADVVDATFVGGSMSCRADIDAVKSGFSIVADFTVDSTGSVGGFTTRYPWPNDMTSYRFQCTMEPGESIEFSSLRLAGQLIDDFNTNASITNSSCNTQDVRNRTITNYFKDIDTRDTYAGSDTGIGTSTVSFAMNAISSTLTFTTSAGGTGCDYPDDPVLGPLITWSSSSSDDNTNFSNAASIRLPFTQAPIDVTGCYLAVQDSAGKAIETVGPVTPTFPEMVFNLSGSSALTSANTFTLYGCNFAVSASMILRVPHTLP